jgi:hypothetical protein
MNQIEQKYFSEGLDGDSADFVVGPGAMINGLNVRYGSTDSGRVGNIESISGTVLVPHTLGAGVNTTIQSIVDEENHFEINFVHNSLGNHFIYGCDLLTETNVSILPNNQIEGGLNFSLDHRMNGCFIVDNLLYFNDAFNEPRKVNLGTLINMFNAFGTVNPYANETEWAYDAPLKYHDITQIKKPGIYPPYISKFEDTAFVNNYIFNESFKFAVEYIYWDGDKSVLSPWTRASKLNAATEKFNKIDVTLGTEAIPSSVQIVRLIVLKGDEAYVVKFWDKKKVDDAAAIVSHNGGVALLKYDFYNNSTGEFLDKLTINKPFDSIGTIVGTQTIARNRVMNGDNTIGENTPTETSMTVTLDAATTLTLGGSTVYSKRLSSLQFFVSGSVGFPYSGWFVEITEFSPQGIYLIQSTESTVSSTLAAVPTTALLSDLTYMGADWTEVYNKIRDGRVDGGFSKLVTSNFVSITTTSDVVYNIFKTGQYKGGVVFYDRYLRKCAVVTRDECFFTVPDSVNTLNRHMSATWTFSATNQLTEIPVWAWYYAPVRTLNLRTRFFLTGISDKVRYVRKDSTGTDDFSNVTWVNDVYAIAVDIGALTASGMGYTFAEGDQMVLADPFNMYTLPITGQSGNYVLLQSKNLAELPASVTSVSGYKVVYEIYRPYKINVQEPFYEVGQFFAVTNAGTNTRAYSVLTGTFLPDAHVVNREYKSYAYLADTMSPNDKYYLRWDTDAGRANVESNLGKVRNMSSLMFSNKYLPGTSVNGLASFDALNEEVLPIEAGRIVKLILTSKAQSEGTVLLAVCAINPCSVYLGEAMISDTSGGAQFFVKTQGVISTVNVLDGQYGTLHHKSVQLFTGEGTCVLWYCVLRACVVQYSYNGLFPVSSYKMNRFFKKYSDRLLSSVLSEQVIGGVDIGHGEYLLTLPAVESAGYSGTLPSTSQPNEFDVYDGQAKTFVYKVKANTWLPPCSFTPEHYDNYGVKLLGFKNGLMYKHNDPAGIDNNFFGVQYKTKVIFVSNFNPKLIKLYKSVSVEGNMAPMYTVFYTQDPNEQITDLVETDWVNQEGVWKAAILRDRLSPNVAGTAEVKLFRGDEIRTPALKVMMEFTTTTKKLKLKFVNIGFHESVGHKT